MADPARLQRFLPPRFGGSAELVAGSVAALEAAEDAAEAMVDHVGIGSNDGKWLTLLARGYGVYRSTGEADADLQARLRNVEDKLTRGSIRDAVDALLDAYTVETCSVEEWFEGDGCFWADEDYCDDQRLLGEWRTFYVLAPSLGVMAWGDFYCDDSFCDDLGHVGAGPDHPIYGAIMAAVERIRAAGVRWLLISEI